MKLNFFTQKKETEQEKLQRATAELIKFWSTLEKKQLKKKLKKIKKAEEIVRNYQI